MQGIIILNKPGGITSFGAVAAVRRLSGEKRAGHTGTLDPDARGVLPVLLGRATALAKYLNDSEKSYLARVRLGITTDTEDISGKILTERVPSVEKTELSAAVSAFSGVIEQVPPMFSALKQNGKRLYELARRGETVSRPPRRVEIFDISFADFDGRDFTLSVRCSKGTYIRSLCRDIGERLGCGAVMTELVRTRASGFDIESSVALSSLDAQNIKNHIRPAEDAVCKFRQVELTAGQAARFSNGGAIFIDRTDISPFDGEILRMKNAGELLGMGVADINSGLIKADCVLVDNLPNKR